MSENLLMKRVYKLKELKKLNDNVLLTMFSNQIFPTLKEVIKSKEAPNLRVIIEIYDHKLKIYV